MSNFERRHPFSLNLAVSPFTLVSQNKDMGSYPGHVLPGSFFIVFGLWWWCNIVAIIAQAQARFLRKRSFTRRTNNCDFEIEFESRTWCKVPVLCLKRFPVEPCLKVIAATIGIMAELTKGEWSLVNKAGHFSHLNNFSHATMFSIFLLSAVVEILRFYNILFLPAATDHVFVSLSFFLVGELFYFHIDGRSKLDQKLHTLLYTVSFSIAVVILLEAWQRKSFVLFLTRTFLVLLLGTWFIQIAHVLYGSHPWKDTDSNRAIIVVTFSWHVLGLLAMLTCSLLLVSVGVKLKRSTCIKPLTTAGDLPREGRELDSLMSTEQGNEELTQID